METQLRNIICSITTIMCAAVCQPRTPGPLIPQNPDTPVNVIVRYREPTSTDEAVRRLGRLVRHNHDLWLLRGHAVTVRAGDIAAIAARPEVEAVLPDNTVSATAFSGSPDYGWMSVLGLTSNTATLSYDGTGVGVAIIDSGLSMDPDFITSNVVHQENLIPGNNTPATSMDTERMWRESSPATANSPPAAPLIWFAASLRMYRS